MDVNYDEINQTLKIEWNNKFERAYLDQIFNQIYNEGKTFEVRQDLESNIMFKLLPPQENS